MDLIYVIVIKKNTKTNKIMKTKKEISEYITSIPTHIDAVTTEKEITVDALKDGKQIFFPVRIVATTWKAGMWFTKFEIHSKDVEFHRTSQCEYNIANFGYIVTLRTGNARPVLARICAKGDNRLNYFSIL